MILIGACRTSPAVRSPHDADSSPPSNPWRTIAQACDKGLRLGPSEIVTCSLAMLRAAGHSCIDLSERLDLCVMNAAAGGELCDLEIRRLRESLDLCESRLDSAKKERWFFFGGGAAIGAIVAAIVSLLT